MIQVGYADFIKLCRVHTPTDWHDYEVKKDGVYIVPPPDDICILPTERAALSKHPYNDLKKPALAFPCSLEQLQRFLEEGGVYESIDPFDMADFVCKKYQNTLTSNTVASNTSDNPKSTNTLLKMIAVMAIDGYGYKPKENKSKIPGEISAGADILGVPISSETVLKWLRQSVDLVDQDKLA